MRSSRNKQRRAGYAAIVTVLTVAIAACSSAPDPPEAIVAIKNEAARFIEFGNAEFDRANYELALQNFELALTRNTSVDHLPGIAGSRNSIGRVYAALGDIERAQAEYEEAERIARQAGAPNVEAQALSNMGELQLRAGADEAAFDLFTRAEQLSDEGTPDPVLIHNLGTAYARLGDLDRAAAQFERAAAINEEARSWRDLASNYYMLASVAARRNDLDAAQRFAERALDEDKRAEHIPGIAADLAALGQIHQRLSEYEVAYDYYLRASRVAITLNVAADVIDYLRSAAEVASELGLRNEAAELSAQADLVAERMAAAQQ